MPELPEVETIARGLDPLVRGQRIEQVRLLTPSVLRQGNIRDLPGQCITGVSRRAKLLLLALDQGNCLAFHLKMTGRVWVTGQECALPKHTHLVCILEGGYWLVFEDQRRFGFCGLYSPAALAAWPFFSALGPEPLQIPAQSLAKLLAGRRAQIKALLLDQTVLAGIGNIYADESLFAARIHPASPAAHLSFKNLELLCAELQRILQEAITAGGSTISDYRNAYGQSGIFQDQFQVYGKKGQPCPACAQPLATVRVAGRTSTHCPHCQPRL